jgi:hypothetical protein
MSAAASYSCSKTIDESRTTEFYQKGNREGENERGQLAQLLNVILVCLCGVVRRGGTNAPPTRSLLLLLLLQCAHLHVTAQGVAHVGWRWYWRCLHAVSYMACHVFGARGCRGRCLLGAIRYGPCSCRRGCVRWWCRMVRLRRWPSRRGMDMR